MSAEGDLTGKSAALHWDEVWGRSDADRVSWHEPHPEASLRLIEAAGIAPDAGIIDVGGGASLLARQLLDAGHTDLTVLDVSSGGLDAGRGRLGLRASEVEWIRADVRGFEPARTWELWHDRAVFHFLTRDEDRQAYLGTVDRALSAGGQLVLATFGPEGPTRCSGLEVRRYSSADLAEAFGPGYRLAESRLETHVTPAGAIQQFLYARFGRSTDRR